VVAASAYRICYALAGAALVITQALVVNKVVHWNPWVVVGIAGGVGLLAFVDNLRLLRFKFLAAERNGARARMYRPLTAAFVSISEARGNISILKLGASVFTVEKRWTRRWKIFPWREERLGRLLRFRISDYPQESNVTWTRDKGAIGACWTTGQPVLRDRRATAARYGRPNYPTEAQLQSMSVQEHCGMTLPEFIQTIGKYGEILAAPVVARNKGKLIGVLSIDCLADAYASPSSPSILAGDDIEVFALRAARLLQDHVAKF
jgi:hypothetical protein